MPVKKDPQQCKNPDCAVGTFIPNHGNRRYCDEECKEHHKRKMKKEKNQTVFANEEKLRQNHKVLEILYQYPPHRSGVDLEYLQHLGFDFNVYSSSGHNKTTSQPVRYSHGYGIELIQGSNPNKFFIYKR